MFRLRFSGCAAVAVGILAGIATPTDAAIRNAASCSQSDVAAAVTSASHGDTVRVPAGTCSWSGFSLSKAIELRGAGIGLTRITLAANNTVTKQTAGATIVAGFSFTRSGGGNASKGWTINGPWPGGEPVIFTENDYAVSNSGLFLVTVAGGVIISNSSFSGGWDDSFLQLKDHADSGKSWGTADSMGTRDSNGRLNTYVESNTFVGGTNQGIDADDAVRLVYRYNTLTTSSVNSHGLDTSPIGVRHWEIYNNKFIHPGSSCTTQLCNQNWLILMRGGTGVIADNQFADIAGGHWGNKTELHFWIRGAEDVRPQGSCSSVKYPVPRQLGQGHNGTTYVTDPIYIWSNVGAQAFGGGWRFGNPCGLDFDAFFEEGRDYVLGAKPGYAKYTYPHPLLTGAPQLPNLPPPPPSNLRVVSQ